MRIKRLLLWSLFGLAASLILASSWLWYADLGILKPHLERWVSEQTGREFAIDGDFTVDLSSHTVVIANDVRFENADWAEEPQMLEIGRAEIRLDFWSLFNGPFIIELVDINDVEIQLVRRDDDNANWELPLSSTESDTDDKTNGGFGVLFELIDIDRVHVRFEEPDRDGPLDLRIEYLDQRLRNDDYLDLDLRATLGDREIWLKGEAGTLENLLAGQDIRYSIESQLDTFEIESKGWIDDIAEPRRPSIEFSARGPDIDDLFRLLAIPQDADGDINLSGALTSAADSPLLLKVNGNVGQAKIEAAGSFSDLQDLERIDIDLLASGPDLGRILRVAGIHQVREAPFMIDINAKRDGSVLLIDETHMVFADAEFNVSARMPFFPSIDDAEISVNMAGPDIERFRYVTGLPGTATGEFSAGLEVVTNTDGAEKFQLELTTSLGEVSASGSLSDAPDYIGSTAEVNVTADSLAAIGSAYGLPSLPAESAHAKGSLKLTAEGIRITQPLKINVNETAISLEGLIALTNGIAGSDLFFSLSGPGLAELTSAFDVTEGIPNQPYNFNGNLLFGANDIRLQDISGTLGSSALHVDGLLVLDSGLSGSQVTFSAAGPAFEEVTQQFEQLNLRPGDYELSGRIALLPDHVVFDGIELIRETGKASLDMELGLPVSRRWAVFSLRADGRDVRNVLGGIESYQPELAPFLVDAHGELRNSHLTIDRFEAGIGDARLQAEGELDFGDYGSSTRFHFSGDIPHLSQLGSFNQRRLRDQAITWSANVAGGGGVLAIDDLTLKLGESDVRGSVRLAKGDVPSLNVDIHSDSVVFGPLFEEAEIVDVEEPDFEDGRLIPDVAVPFDAMKKLNATINLDIGALHRDSLHIRNVFLLAELQDGTFELHDAGFDGHSGWIRGKASMAPADGSGQASIELVADDFNLGVVTMDDDHRMIGDFNIKLDSSGLDARSLAGNASGVLFADLRGGRLQNSSRALQAIYGDVLTEIVNTINPFYEAEPYTDIECIVISQAIDNGKSASAPNLLFMTDKIRVVPRLSIDLDTEAINIDVRMRPRRGLTFSSGELFNSFVKVTGTLAAPRLAVDEAGALVSGGAAVATGGLSILAGVAWDRLSRSKTPCEDTAQSGQEELGGRFSSLERRVSDQAVAY